MKRGLRYTPQRKLLQTSFLINFETLRRLGAASNARSVLLTRPKWDSERSTTESFVVSYKNFNASDIFMVQNTRRSMGIGQLPSSVSLSKRKVWTRRDRRGTVVETKRQYPVNHVAKKRFTLLRTRRRGVLHIFHKCAATSGENVSTSCCVLRSCQFAWGFAWLRGIGQRNSAISYERQFTAS